LEQREGDEEFLLLLVETLSAVRDRRFRIDGSERIWGCLPVLPVLSGRPAADAAAPLNRHIVDNPAGYPEPSTRGRPTAVGSAGFAGANVSPDRASAFCIEPRPKGWATSGGSAAANPRSGRRSRLRPEAWSSTAIPDN